MTDNRMVRLEQIAAGGFELNPDAYKMAEGMIRTSGYSDWQIFKLKVKPIGDATGGDVYVPLRACDANGIEALRRAKWPHLVQVEVVNG